MRKFLISLITLGLLGGLSISVYAAQDDKGELTLLAGKSGLGSLDFRLNSKLDFTGFYQDGGLRTGLLYHFSDKFGIQAGIRKDIDSKNSIDPKDTEGVIAYEGFQFVVPFGNDLTFAGNFTHNYEGNDWDKYEAYMKLPLYPGIKFDVGARGDSGDGAPTYSFNQEREALIFLRGDLNWASKNKKFALDLRPLLYVRGTFLHDYDFKYLLNDKTALVFNMSSLENNKIKERLGVQWKF